MLCSPGAPAAWQSGISNTAEGLTTGAEQLNADGTGGAAGAQVCPAASTPTRISIKHNRTACSVSRGINGGGTDHVRLRGRQPRPPPGWPTQPRGRCGARRCISQAWPESRNLAPRFDGKSPLEAWCWPKCWADPVKYVFREFRAASCRGTGRTPQASRGVAALVAAQSLKSCFRVCYNQLNN